jgi:hypothetical protein
MGTIHGPSIVMDGLILHFDFSNQRCFMTGETIVNDLTRNFNTGLTVNSPVYESNVYGELDFNGTDQRINLNDFYDMSTSDDISVESWFNRTGDSPGDTVGSCIVCKGALGGGRPGWGLYWTDSTYPFGANILGFQVRDVSDTAVATSITYASSNNGKWIHVIAVRDTENNELRLYVNGQLVNTNSESPLLDPTSVSLTAIASMKEPGSSTYSRELYGKIAIAKIYNIPLTSEQVLQNYNSTKGRFGHN